MTREVIAGQEGLGKDAHQRCCHQEIATMSSSHTIQLPQGPIQYQEQGQGQPVVFVHGLFADHRLWQPLLPGMGQGLRCILPTWPLGAHPVAMKPQADLSVPGMVRLVADFIEALDLRDVILVGNDTGGALSQMVCAQYPDRIAGLVLTTCDAYDVFPPPMFAYLKWMGLVPGATWASAQLLHHIPLLRQLPFTFGDLSDRPLPSGLVEQWLKPMRTDGGVRHDVTKFVRTLSSRYTEEAGLALQHFEAPVLLLWSTRCRHFPTRLAERLQHELPNADLRWLDSTGVFLSMDHPRQVANHIKRFSEARQAQTLKSVSARA
jgi:pimeloyl-ACP methyl ester carboxylesterase